MSQSGEKPGVRGASRLAGMQAQFQQKQLAEKEEKLLQMLNTQQQLAMQKAGLSGVIPPKYGGVGAANGGSSGAGPCSNQSSKSTTPTPSQTSPTVNHPIQTNPGKVRQMSEERHDQAWINELRQNPIAYPIPVQARTRRSKYNEVQQAYGYHILRSSKSIRKAAARFRVKFGMKVSTSTLLRWREKIRNEQKRREEIEKNRRLQKIEYLRKSSRRHVHR